MAISNTLSVLNDPVRREILSFLKSGKKSAGEIAANFDLSKPTISYHLKKMKEVDLIYESKFKNYVYYEINTSVFDEIIIWFSSFCNKEDDG